MKSTGKRPEPRFGWFIPIDGDGKHIGTRRAERPPTFEYLREVVETAEKNGYYSLLIPTRFANGLFEEGAPLAETWTTATALAAVTNKIRFLIAVRPGFISPGLFAQMAATLNQISGGRVDINVVPGGIKGDFERFGETSDHSTRYKRAEEFIQSCRALWASPEPTVFHGEHVTLDGAIVSPSPVDDGPNFYLGGASPSALKLAGQESDVYLLWIQPPGDISSFIQRANKEFVEAGREPRYGLRTHLIVRPTETEAWDDAGELLSMADVVVKEQRASVVVVPQSVNNPEPVAVFGDQYMENYRLDRHLWNGISTVRVNCGTALVGTPEQVAGELLRYWRMGIDEFILSGFPHVEECRRISHDLLPILKNLIHQEKKKV